MGGIKHACGERRQAFPHVSAGRIAAVTCPACRHAMRTGYSRHSLRTGSRPLTFGPQKWLGAYEGGKNGPGRRSGGDLYMTPAGLAPALFLALMQAHAVHALSGAARGTGCTPPPLQRAAAARPPVCMCIFAPGCWTQMQSAALHPHVQQELPPPTGMQPGRGGMRTRKASCMRTRTHFLSA